MVFTSLDFIYGMKLMNKPDKNGITTSVPYIFETPAFPLQVLMTTYKVQGITVFNESFCEACLT